MIKSTRPAGGWGEAPYPFPDLTEVEQQADRTAARALRAFLADEPPLGPIVEDAIHRAIAALERNQ